MKNISTKYEDLNLARQGEVLNRSFYAVHSLGITDLEEVTELEIQGFQNPWSLSLLARELNNPERYIPGVRFNGELIAQVFSFIVVDELHILNLTVRKCFRRQGIGRALLAHLLAYAIAEGVGFAFLEARISNAAALQLYRSLGFNRIGTRKSYYRDTGEDAAVLSRELGKEDLPELMQISCELS